VPEKDCIELTWSDDDVERFLRLVEAGSSLADMARYLGLKEDAIAQKAEFLGVMLPQHESLPLGTITSDSSTTRATMHCVPANSSLLVTSV
jgi:hypothetical protein